jgi:ribosomal protein L7/L12
MNSEIELPEDVVAEIEANRKVTAIKLLRKHMGIGLKEAKELVDAYIEKNPPASTPRVAKTDTGIGRIIILIIGVGAIYGLYKFFT